MAAVVNESPAGSAIQRAIDPDWWLTPEAFLLREIEHQLRILQWQQTENGAKGRMNTLPKAIPLTDVEQRRHEAETGHYNFDSVDIDDARIRLGWDKRNGRVA